MEAFPGALLSTYSHRYSQSPPSPPPFPLENEDKKRKLTTESKLQYSCFSLQLKPRVYIFCILHPHPPTSLGLVFLALHTTGLWNIRINFLFFSMRSGYGSGSSFTKLWCDFRFKLYKKFLYYSLFCVLFSYLVVVGNKYVNYYLNFFSSCSWNHAFGAALALFFLPIL